MKKYIVIERLRTECSEENKKRYNSNGRMFPKGLYYLNSWMNADKNICFQLMETNDESLFQEWFRKWQDIVDFELYPID